MVDEPKTRLLADQLSSELDSAEAPLVRREDYQQRGWGFFALRRAISIPQAVAAGVLCVLLVWGLWYFVTRGEAESRIVSPAVLPSPAETFGKFHDLWFDRALTRNVYASLRRVTLGFALAVVVGVPVGILGGCFSWFGAFLAPLSIFGRNIPVAALIPLTFSLFGIGDQQKIMFIFIATVAFITSDSARAVLDVDRRYMDTSYTLGASRRQIIMKVLVPLSLPSIFNSLRLLFGLAFGYIMLAELVKFGGESGGLGDIIITSQRRNQKEHILLVLLIIPIIALCIDRALFWIQRQLFPYRYGSDGILHQLVRVLFNACDDLKSMFRRQKPAAAVTNGPDPGAGK